MGKVGDAVGTFDKVLSVLERLGLWGAAGATVVSGAVFWVWSAMISLPGPVIALCGLFGAAGGLWLYDGLRNVGRSRLAATEKPDYEAWDHVEFLNLAQAANLWAECEPSGGVKKKAYPYLRMLKEQAMLENIETNTEPGKVTMDSMVQREDLLALATAKKLFPKFLFPEER